MEIVTHPHNNSLVIFIHGVMSEEYSGWKPVIRLLQNIRKGSAPILSYDFCTVSYETGHFRQPPVTQYFKILRGLIDQERYDSVVLVGHSQGGILAKLFVIDQLQNGRGLQMKIDMVITFDTPHRGPQPWIYPVVLAGWFFKLIPVVNRLCIWRQIAEMSCWSNNLRRLKKHWTDTIIATAPCPPEETRRYIRSLTVAGPRLPFLQFKVVVSRRSAHGFRIDTPIQTRPAWGIGHGVGTMLEQCRSYIEQELTELGQEAFFALKQAFFNIAPHELQIALNNASPGLGTACEVTCWQARLRGFEIKPLRNLPFAAALGKFINLRLGNP